MVKETGLKDKSKESSNPLQDVNKLAASMSPLSSTVNGKGKIDTSMSNGTSSSCGRKTVKTPSNKGTFSKSESPCLTSKSNISSKSIPKFNDRGICVRCNSDQSVNESICCHLCNDRFHACCREKRGSISSNAICTPSTLKYILPLIAKYGNQSERWGNFMFICDRCSKKISSLKNTVKTSDNSCNTSFSNTDNTGAKTSDSSLTSDDSNDLASNRCSRDTGSVQLLADVSSTVKSILVNFESDLMSKVDKLLEERSLSSSEQRTPNSSQRTSTPSSSAALSEESTALSDFSVMAMPSPQAASASKQDCKSYLEAAKGAQHRNSIDSYLSHVKSLTSCSIEDASVRSPHEDHVVVLSGSDDSVDLGKAEESIGNSLNSVPVNFLRNNKKSNKLVISFPSAKDKERGKAMLATTMEVSSHKILVQDAKKMLPKVTVTNIPNGILSSLHNSTPSVSSTDYRTKVKGLLEAKFLEKNKELENYVSNDGQIFKIVFVKTGRDTTTVGIKVSSIIRDFLISKERIYIGNTSCKVSDRFDVRQCFHCQRLGHIASQCRENDPVCMYCGSTHKTVDCNIKGNVAKYRCINCSHSDDPAIQDSCDTHHSGSDSCPIIVVEKHNIRSRTEYSKNV